jgi:hypothetical protein
MAVPAEISELREVGVGIGVGEDDGVGVGIGVGVGVCAWTGDDARATARMKAVATATTSLRQIPVSLAREGRDAQRMNAISKKERQPDKNAKYHRLGG